MICPNCGKEIPEESLFCAECGSKIVRPEANATQGPAQSRITHDAAPDAHGTVGNSTKSLNRKVIGIVGAALIVAALIVVFALTRKPTLDLNKYLVVSYEGYNGYGTATAKMDFEAINKKYAGKLKINKTWLCEELGIEEDDWESFESILQTADYLTDVPGDDEAVNLLYYIFTSYSAHIFDTDEDLSNGDTISHKFNFTEDDIEELEKAFNCKVKAAEKSFTVEGLEEVESYDAFENVSVEFDGIAPYATAKLTNAATDDMGAELQYIIEPSNGLSNGDTVTVKLNDREDASYYAEKYGKVPAEEEKTFTVEGVDSYVSSAADITDEAVETMDTAARELLAQSVEEDWGTGSDFLAATSAGNYFYSEPKDGTEYSVHNYLVLCYRVDVENYGEVKTVLYDEINSYYTYYIFRDLVISDSGEITYDTSRCGATYSTYEIVGCEGIWDGLSWRYYGYGSLDEMVEDIKASFDDEFDSSEDNTFEPETAEYDKTGFSEIPENALSYNGHHYQCVKAPGLTWTDAKARCETKGGHLVTITSEEENNWITQTFHIDVASHYWLGGTRDAAGNVTWVTGEAATYTNWNTNKTEFGADEIYMRTAYEGTWTALVNDPDSEGLYLMGYIIEWDE